MAFGNVGANLRLASGNGKKGVCEAVCDWLTAGALLVGGGRLAAAPCFRGCGRICPWAARLEPRSRSQNLCPPRAAFFLARLWVKPVPVSNPANFRRLETPFGFLCSRFNFPAI